MAKFGSLDELRKKEEEERGIQSYSGGEKSGLAVLNPDKDKDKDDQWKRMQQMASGSSGPVPSDHRNVTVYRNGFVVDGGPLRPSSDPLNKKFMDEMAAGRCPAELQAGAREPVHVALHDKRGEDYKEPPGPAHSKFSGGGNSLGGSSSAAAAPPAPSVIQAEGSVEVDASKPKTRLQIRFHDGQKKAQEFNEGHTVGDLRAFCSQVVGGQAMTVMGGYPPKPLTDDAVTLKDAGLCGAMVTVKPAS